MKLFISLFAALAPLAVWATEAPTSVSIWQSDRGVVLDASDLTLSDFEWIARPVVVFADSPNDPRFAEQMGLIEAEIDRLAERDVVVITDTDPDARSDLRTKLRPRGFALVLVAKDGRVNLRKPAPWSVRELTRAIDKMPLRQQELGRAN